MLETAWPAESGRGSVQLLPTGAMAAHQRLGLDNTTDWDRRVCIHDGRLVGYTVHPGTSLCQPNYLPAEIRRCHRQLTTRQLSNGLEYIAMAFMSVPAD
jgi:hypothetical protein